MIRAHLAVLAVGVVLWGSAACDDAAPAPGRAGSATPDPAEAFLALPAAQIEKRAIAAMEELDTLAYSGTIGSAGGETMAVEVAFDTDGNCRARTDLNGAVARRLATGGHLYLKGNRRFWVSAAGPTSARHLMSLLGNKWARLPSDDAGFGRLCAVDTLLKEFGKPSGKRGNPAYSSVTDLDGQRAVQVISNEPDSAAVVTLWVAVAGEHRILRISRVGGFEPASITFSGFDEPVSIHEPAEGDYVDLNNPTTASA